jgi:hypothetical protein
MKKKPMIRLTAVRDLAYAGKSISKDADFDATVKDGEVLIALNRAIVSTKPVREPVVTEVPAGQLVTAEAVQELGMTLKKVVGAKEQEQPEPQVAVEVPEPVEEVAQKEAAEEAAIEEVPTEADVQVPDQVPAKEDSLLESYEEDNDYQDDHQSLFPSFLRMGKNEADS